MLTTPTTVVGYHLAVEKKERKYEIVSDIEAGKHFSTSGNRGVFVMCSDKCNSCLVLIYLLSIKITIGSLFHFLIS